MHLQEQQRLTDEKLARSRAELAEALQQVQTAQQEAAVAKEAAAAALAMQNGDRNSKSWCQSATLM